MSGNECDREISGDRIFILFTLCCALCVPDVGAHGQGPLRAHGARKALGPPRVPPVEHTRVPGIELQAPSVLTYRPRHLRPRLAPEPAVIHLVPGGLVTSANDGHTGHRKCHHDYDREISGDHIFILFIHGCLKLVWEV